MVSKYKFFYYNFFLFYDTDVGKQVISVALCSFTPKPRGA
jgi:hypothetical protein